MTFMGWRVGGALQHRRAGILDGAFQQYWIGKWVLCKEQKQERKQRWRKKERVNVFLGASFAASSWLGQIAFGSSGYVPARPISWCLWLGTIQTCVSLSPGSTFFQLTTGYRWHDSASKNVLFLVESENGNDCVELLMTKCAQAYDTCRSGKAECKCPVDND